MTTVFEHVPEVNSCSWTNE